MTLFGGALNRPELIGTTSAGTSVISMRRASDGALADQSLAEPIEPLGVRAFRRAA